MIVIAMHQQRITSTSAKFNQPSQSSKLMQQLQSRSNLCKIQKTSGSFLNLSVYCLIFNSTQPEENEVRYQALAVGS